MLFNVIVNIFKNRIDDRKVLAIGAANSEKGGIRKGVNFNIITCADPVPGTQIHYRHREVGLRSGAILRCKYEAFQR